MAEITQEEVMFMLMASYIAGEAYLKKDLETAFMIDQFYQQVLAKRLDVPSWQYWQLAQNVSITMNGKDVRPKKLLWE